MILQDHNIVRKKRIEREPWFGAYCYIKARCSWKESPYYKKGIKCLITISELQDLWDRDKGWLLKRPSIDRIDTKGHYEVSNCRFIELSENCRKGGSTSSPLKGQYDREKVGAGFKKGYDPRRTALFKKGFDPRRARNDVAEAVAKYKSLLREAIEGKKIKGDIMGFGSASAKAYYKKIHDDAIDEVLALLKEE